MGALLGVVAVVVALVVTGDRDGREPARTSIAPTVSTSSPVPGVPEPLTVELGRLVGHSQGGRLPRATLRAASRDVREVMTQIYTVGFVDPARWGGGSFPSLLASFAPTARTAARGDLGALTVGRLADRLDEVIPAGASLDVRVIADRRDRPVVAFATMRFRATGLGPGVQIPIRNDGEYVLRRIAGGWRIVGYDVANRVSPTDDADQGVRRARHSPPIPSGDPMFVLVIGSDARPGTNPVRALADSIHIVGVNPGRHRAAIVGIPRDSFVPIPGHGSDKINASLARGGPDLVVDTVERLSGVPIDAYVLTGFGGFRHIIERVGKIGIDIPYPMNDPYSHARFRAGPTRLNSRNALAFSRNRHDARGGDFGRSLNQGRLLIAFLAALREDLRGEDLGVLPWLLAGATYAETDLDLGQMVDLLLAVPSIAPGDVRNRVVSGHTATVGGKSVVVLSPGARAIFRDLRDAVLRG